MAAESRRAGTSERPRNSREVIGAIDRRDLRLAVFGKEVIERFGEERLDRGLMLGRQEAELGLDLSREIAGDVGLAHPPWPEMRVMLRPPSRPAGVCGCRPRWPWRR